SRLQASGRHHVTTVCRSNYEAIHHNGFKIRSTIFGDHTFHPDCVVRSVEDAAQQDRAYDYVFLCTKAFPSLVNSADVVAPLVSERTGIVAAQNGIGIEDGLLRSFPNNPVFAAALFLMSVQASPGEIVNSGFLRFIIGANPPAQDMPAGESRTAASERFRRDQLVAQALVMDLRLSNVPIDLTDNIQGYRWLKVAWNIAFNPVAVVGGGRETGEILADPYGRQLVLDLLREVWKIGETVTGRPLPPMQEFESPEAVIERTAKRVAYKPSMVQDYLNGRPMELETIVKNPLDLARRFGVPAPHLETIYALIRVVATSGKPED
ncbi:hypothetical protein IWQ60_011425, partial [Tieghemiomyces parasiticus]